MMDTLLLRLAQLGGQKSFQEASRLVFCSTAGETNALKGILNGLIKGFLMVFNGELKGFFHGF